MVQPACFGFNAETAASNAFQHLPLTKASEVHNKALLEFNTFVKKLLDAGINVNVFSSSDPGTPDAIFPNNWFSTHHDGTLVLYPMLSQNRRMERTSGLIEVLKKDFYVRSIIDLTEFEQQGMFLEGTGSIVFDHTNRKAYAVISPRTSTVVMEKLCEELQYEAFFFHCTDDQGKDVYHTNVVLNIGENYAMYCEEGMPDMKSRLLLKESLAASGRELITLSLQQVKNFCGNMLQLRTNNDLLLSVCSERAYGKLTVRQKEILSANSKLLPAAIPVIENSGGGSVRCMLAEIFLNKKGGESV